MRYAFIGIRNGRDLTPVFGPVPEAEAVEEFKARTTADHQAEGADGQFHGALELYGLRATRSYKLRVPPADQASVPPVEGSAPPADQASVPPVEGSAPPADQASVPPVEGSVPPADQGSVPPADQNSAPAEPNKGKGKGKVSQKEELAGAAPQKKPATTHPPGESFLHPDPDNDVPQV